MVLSMLYVFTCGLLCWTHALDNGLALTPPMGWLSWLRFGCTIDCDAKPNECISENLIRRTADLMVSEGYLAAGYRYITIDDCWLEKERSPDGRLVPDKKRFPSGMKALSDYVHSKGLLFGLYEDYGNMTCERYPGIRGHELYDADTLASWETDYLKLDGCFADVEGMSKGYPAFGRILNATGRPILYACSWPFFQETNGIRPNYSSVADSCNIWRNWYDIRNSWSSVQSVMTWIGDNQDRLAPYAGPGHWNDPDMLVVGNSGLTVDQAQVQMAVWSILAAPLMMSVDLAQIDPAFKQILLNRDVIAVSQDKLGKQGLRVWNSGFYSMRPQQEIWHRELSEGARAIAFVNMQATFVTVSYSYDNMKLPSLQYNIKDLYNVRKEKTLKPGEKLTVHINPTGVKFYKFTPMT
nr:alpha-N-acetylgalactosaminidase [Helicoverpa armigera]